MQIKNWVGAPLFLGLAFVVAVGVFLHFREVSVEVLDLGTKAPRYIIGQVDFSFPDKEATELLRQEAVRDITPIFKLDEKQIHQRRFAFESELVRDQSWRQTFEETSFEELYKDIGWVEELLLESRFTSSRTFQRMKDLRFPIENVFVFMPQAQGSAIFLPGELWKQIEKEVFAQEAARPEVAAFVLKAFEQEPWNIQDDLSAERELRELVQGAVPMMYTPVSAGSHIIDRGEKVSERHIDMMQAMKSAVWDGRNLWQPLTIAGSMLLSGMITLLCALYFRLLHPQIFGSLHKMLLLVSVAVLTLFLAKFSEYFLLNKAAFLIDLIRYPLFVPFATLLICLLVGGEVSFFVSAFLIVIIGVSLAIDRDRFLIVNLIASLTMLISARRLHKRKEIFTVCAKAWLSCIPVIISFNLFDNTLWNLHMMTDLLSTLAFLMLTAILASSLLPLLESLFHVMTDMTLMEYMDPNNVLLRRLTLEAPGTYQHSLAVGSLSEAAAREVGANGLFCRVSTLYHDIGKLFNPHYFTENQLGGFNIHQLLTPQESTNVIMAHIKEGEELARRYRLPQSFIDIIRQHHGTTLVSYFYHKQIEQVGGDRCAVNQEVFRYGGPRPHSKESAIIMIADSVEAASRCLEDVREEAVAEMVSRLVADKQKDGQFESCQLTFEELEKVKKAMVRTLLVTHHLRVKYPERK